MVTVDNVDYVTPIGGAVHVQLLDKYNVELVAGECHSELIHSLL